MNIIETNIKWNSALSDRRSTGYIALHHAEASTCTVMQVDAWHKDNGWAGIGYHFFVRKNGEIYRGRPLNKVGAHVSGMNNDSIGICAEGSYMTETMPKAQKKAICELLVYLKDNYYPNAKITGHGEIGSSNCPGKNFPLEDIKQNYRKYAGTPAVEMKTDLEQILSALLRKGIISNVDLWRNMAKEDTNILYLLQKLLYYAETKPHGEYADDEYTDTAAILRDLNYRGIISDIDLWRDKVADSNVYWLMRKALHYFRTL